MTDEVRQAEGARGVVRHCGGCVVLSPPGSPLLGLLLPALTSRWESMSVVTDEPAVMEALASGGVSMLVVVEPGAWAHLRALAQAMGQHYGQVLCMKFEVEPGEREPRITSLASRWLGTVGRAAPAGRAPGTAGASLAGTGGVDAASAGGDDMLASPADAAGDRAAVCAELDMDEAMMRPKRKIDGLAVSPPEDESSKPAESGPPESLVTQEEMSMLLGSGPGEVA